MKLTIEIDDDQIRRVLASLLQQAPSADPQSATKLLTVRDVAARLGVSRGKAYELVMRGEIESLSIGRSRRVSPAALAAFISKPRLEQELVRNPSYSSGSARPQPSRPQPPPVANREATRRHAKETRRIDLTPRPMSPTGASFSDAELQEFVESLIQKGWLPDLVDQIQEDRRNGVERVYVLTINDTARYLGLSRSGVEKLIACGKLRLFSIAPTYRDEQPVRRIPAKDVLALK